MGGEREKWDNARRDRALASIMPGLPRVTGPAVLLPKTTGRFCPPFTVTPTNSLRRTGQKSRAYLAAFFWPIFRWAVRLDAIKITLIVKPLRAIIWHRNRAYFGKRGLI